MEDKKEYYRKNKKKILTYQKAYLMAYRKTANGKLSSARGAHKRRALCKNERSDISPARWARILESQNNRCNVCHKRFSKKFPPTQDHIVPISKNGSLQSSNIQALCSSCNSSKHAKVDLSYIQAWCV